MTNQYTKAQITSAVVRLLLKTGFKKSQILASTTWVRNGSLKLASTEDIHFQQSRVPALVFMIDLEPGFRWEHCAAYLMVYRNGKYQLERHSSLPVYVKGGPQFKWLDTI